MKKFLSVGLLALVAMATNVFTSCGDDDEEESDNSFKFYLCIDCMAFQQNVGETVKNTYQQIVGSDATLTTSSNFKTIYIACPESKKEAVKEKLASVSDETLKKLDADLEALQVASYVEINIHNGDYDQPNFFAHEYKMDPAKFLPGTYTSTLKDGSAVQIVISAPENGKYPAIVTVGTESYSNTFELTQTSDGPTFDFYDKDGKDFAFNCAGDIHSSFQHGFDQFTANVRIGDDRSVGCIFKRQK